MFDPVRDALAAKVRLLTPDLRGFGAGAALGEPPPEPTLALLADDVVTELDELGIDRAIFGGVSMGGYVAMAVLRRHPERVAGLLLVDTRSGADDAAALERRRVAAERADHGDIAAGSDAIAPLVAQGSDPALTRWLAEIAGGVPAATVGWAQRAMAARPDLTELLAGTGFPVLVVVGENDAVTPPAAARQMAAAAPEAELIELPGVGHLSPAEDPAGFADAVLRWLSRRF
jgi:pimeloyl-ACP methyl ester carboxylesterase